jgi:hypothetical protein
MSLIKLSLVGNNSIIPGHGESGYSDIPAGDWKISNLFYSVLAKGKEANIDRSIAYCWNLEVNE